jgi:Cytochrome C oxidase, cbb3-type, subunit III
MKTRRISRGSIPVVGGLAAMILAVLILAAATSPTEGGDGPCCSIFHKHAGYTDVGDGHIETMNGGYWLWMRSPEQEKVVVISLYNRYCIRCHGSDGRGVWDIPDVPDFANVRWQASRTDDQIVRITLEGRGACMPQFRGAMSIEETWGVARYLRSFVPGTEMSKPDLGSSGSRRTTSKTASTPPANPAPISPVASAAIPPPTVFRALSPSTR